MGNLGGTFTLSNELAAIIARGQETGPNGEMALRVVPIVAGESPRDLLTFPDADLAILALPLLRAQLARDKTFSKQVTYVAPLFRQGLHILARADVRELADLKGKSVNVGPEGGINQTVGRRVLSAVRVRVEELNLDQAAADRVCARERSPRASSWRECRTPSCARGRAIQDCIC